MSSSDKYAPTLKADVEPTGGIAQDIEPRKPSPRDLDGHVMTREEDLEHGTLLLGIGPSRHFEGNTTDDVVEGIQLASSSATTAVTTRNNFNRGEVSMFPSIAPTTEPVTQSEITSGSYFESTGGEPSTRAGNTIGLVQYLSDLIADLHIEQPQPRPEKLDDHSLDDLGSANLQLSHPQRFSRLKNSLTRLEAVISDDRSLPSAEAAEELDGGAEVSLIPTGDIIPSPWNFEFAWTGHSLLFAGEELKVAEEGLETLSLQGLDPSCDLRESSLGSCSSVFNSTRARSLDRRRPKLKHRPVVKFSPEQIERWLPYLSYDYARTCKPNARSRQRTSPQHHRVSDNTRFRTLAPAPSASGHGASRSLRPDGGPGDGSDGEDGNGDKAPTSSPIPSPEWRCFVCPYVRRYPDPSSEFYRSCAHSLHQISHLKQHLRKKHRLQYCRDCRRVFGEPADPAGRAALAQHRQIRSCFVHPKQGPPRFITDEQLALINRRFNRRMMLDQEHHYQYIYGVLFPDDPSRPDPYMSREELDRMKELKRYARKSALRVIMAHWPQVMETPLQGNEIVLIRPIIDEWVPRTMADNGYYSGRTSGEPPVSTYFYPAEDSESRPQLSTSLSAAFPQVSLGNDSAADILPLPVLQLGPGQSEDMWTQNSTDFEAQLRDFDVGSSEPPPSRWDSPVDYYGLPVREADLTSLIQFYPGDNQSVMTPSNIGALSGPDILLTGDLEFQGIDDSVIDEDYWQSDWINNI